MSFFVGLKITSLCECLVTFSATEWSISVWIRTCSTKFWFEINILQQTVQLKFFVTCPAGALRHLEWLKTCLLKLRLVVYFLTQNVQLNGVLLPWNISCAFKSNDLTNILSHCEQWNGSSVDSFMFFEMAGSYEFLFTDRAIEWLIFCVNSLVNFMIVFIFEFLVTNRTVKKCTFSSDLSFHFCWELLSFKSELFELVH